MSCRVLAEKVDLVLFYEDFEVGREFSSESHVVLDEEIRGFAELTGDLNRLHVDESYARGTVFKGRIAHGLLVLSLALGLWFKSGITSDSMIALLGFEGMAFRSPVKPGDSIRLVSVVSSKRSSKSDPGAGIVEMRDQVLCGGKPAIEFTRVLLVRKGPGRQP